MRNTIALTKGFSLKSLQLPDRRLRIENHPLDTNKRNTFLSRKIEVGEECINQKQRLRPTRTMTRQPARDASLLPGFPVCLCSVDPLNLQQHAMLRKSLSPIPLPALLGCSSQV